MSFCVLDNDFAELNETLEVNIFADQDIIQLQPAKRTISIIDNDRGTVHNVDKNNNYNIQFF